MSFDNLVVNWQLNFDKKLNNNVAKVCNKELSIILTYLLLIQQSSVLGCRQTFKIQQQQKKHIKLLSSTSIIQHLCINKLILLSWWEGEAT